MIRRARRRARRRRSVVIAGAGGALLAAVAVVLLVSTGGDGDQGSSSGRPDALPATTTTSAPPPPPPFERYWFTGDSVADNLSDPMGSLAAARGLSWTNATTIGCRVLPGRPTLPDGTPAGPEGCVSLEARVAAQEPGDAQVAVILSSWEISGVDLGAGVLPFATPPWEQATFDLWSRTLDALEAAGIRSVVIVAPAPPTDWIAALSPEGLQYARDVHTYERFLARVAARRADLVTVVRLSSIVCPGGPCPRVVDGVELRPGDGGHLSTAGAAAVAAELIDAVVVAANRVA